MRLGRYVILPITEAIEAVEAVDSWLLRVFLYRVPRDWLLDTLLGPAEDWTDVPDTSPPTPPPEVDGG